MDKIHVLSKWNRLLDLSPNYHIYDTKRIDHKNRPMHLVITIFYRYQTRTRNRVMQHYSRLIFACFVHTDCVRNVGTRTKFTTSNFEIATRRFPCTNWIEKEKLYIRRKICLNEIYAKYIRRIIVETKEKLHRFSNFVRVKIPSMLVLPLIKSSCKIADKIIPGYCWKRNAKISWGAAVVNKYLGLLREHGYFSML